MKKLLKWIAVALIAPISIILAINVWFVWTTDSRLKRQLAAIRDAGDPLSLADLAPESIPPEKNAATYLRLAAGDADAIWSEVEESAEARDYFCRSGSSMSSPMPAKVRLMLKAAFDARPNVIALLRQAAECPGYDAKLDYTLPAEDFMTRGLSSVWTNRNFARMLNYQSRLLTAEGKRDDAIRSTLVLLRLADHFDRNPTLLSYLLAITFRCIALEAANDAMQTGPVSRGVREALDAELARQERMEGFVWALKSERAVMLESSATTVPLHNLPLFSRACRNRRDSDCLEVFHVFIATTLDPAASGVDPDITEIWNAIGREELSGDALLLVGVLHQAHEAMERTQAMIRSLRVLNALQLHASVGNNKPSTLAGLGLPAETITDPFTGAPLRVKKTARGWLIYSVGKNLQDDGGKLEECDVGDVGIGPPPVAKPDEPASK